MTRRIGTVLLAAMVAVGGTLMPAGLAQAAPVRSDSSTENVYFVHGYAAGQAGFDVCAYWCDAIRAVDINNSWAGALHGVAFYEADSNFSVRMSSRTHETPIKDLGRDLAWLVYNRETAAGRSVDLVGHSMGGLIIRAALTGVARHEAGFPAYLYVEDVVTLATPHTGTSWWAGICPTHSARTWSRAPPS